MQTRKRFIRRLARLPWKDDEMITFDANQWVGTTEERQAKKLDEKQDELMEELKTYMDREDALDKKFPIIHIQNAARV